MDEATSVCAVFVDGTAKIYGVAPKGSKVRPLIRTLKFNTYGQALQHAIEFEDKEKAGKKA